MATNKLKEDRLKYYAPNLNGFPFSSRVKNNFFLLVKHVKFLIIHEKITSWQDEENMTEFKSALTKDMTS